MRKYLLRALIVIVVLTVGGYLLAPQLTSWEGKNEEQKAEQIISNTHDFYLRQIVTQDNSHARMIMWQMPNFEANSLVEYRVRGTKVSQGLTVKGQPFTDNHQTRYIYSGLLQNLHSGTQYEYRIGYDNYRSKWYSFTTADNGDFKALVFPDSQSNDYTDWKNLVQAAYQKHPDADFFINMGDLVDNGEDQSQWQAWFDAVSELIQVIPFAPVQGNHETYDLNWQVRSPRAYLNYFAVPSPFAGNNGRHYYSFDYSDVHFVVLNTQIEELVTLEPNLQTEQLAWLEKDLATTEQPWKVVLMHRDVLQYGHVQQPQRQAGFSTVGTIFMPLFDHYGVDVVLSAHLHTYRRRGQIYNFHKAQRGPLYILTGVAGNVRYSGIWQKHELDEAAAPEPETNNYLTLERVDNKLRLAAFLSTGKRIDFVEISK